MERDSNKIWRFSTLELMEVTSKLMFWMSNLILVDVGLQGNDGVVKSLVAGVGHLGGKHARSG
jgi:hypothetical protein